MAEKRFGTADKTGIEKKILNIHSKSTIKSNHLVIV